MGIVSFASIIEAATSAALDKSEQITAVRNGRCSGRWYFMYCREIELFRIYCLLSGRGL